MDMWIFQSLVSFTISLASTLENSLFIAYGLAENTFPPNIRWNLHTQNSIVGPILASSSLYAFLSHFSHSFSSLSSASPPLHSLSTLFYSLHPPPLPPSLSPSLSICHLSQSPHSSPLPPHLTLFWYSPEKERLSTSQIPAVQYQQKTPYIIHQY